MTDLGNKIKDLRKSAGLTQEAAAKKLDITRSSLANYESGIRIPDYNVLASIASLYNVTIDSIVGREQLAAYAVVETMDWDNQNISDIDTVIIEKDSPKGKLFQLLDGASDDDVQTAIRIIEALRN